MNASESIRSAVQSILGNKFRSFLTMLGVVIGIFSVVLLIASAKGVKKQIEGFITSLGPTTLIMLPGASLEAGKPSFSQGFATSTITEDDINFLKERVTIVDTQSFEYAIFGGGIVNFKDKKVAPFVIGGTTGIVDYFKIPIAKGRNYSEAERQAGFATAVIGATVAKNLGISDTGETVQIGKEKIEIIGIGEATNQFLFGFNLDDVVLLPTTTVARMVGRSTFDRVYFKALTTEQIPAAAAEVRQLMAERHGIEDVTVSEQKDILGILNNILTILTALLSGIASISLLVGGIGIMNIMLVSVTERTREIGIRKALGATDQAILVQFLVEAILLTVIGAAIAVLLSIIVATIVAKQTPISPIISWQTIVLAVSVSIGIGITFGLFPAIRAARKTPVEALRYE